MGTKARIATKAASMRKRRKKESDSDDQSHSGTESELHASAGASVSDKLEVLKSLIPSEKTEIKADELFKETADYIIHLRAQVFVLQQLIDFYGSQNGDAV